MQGHVLERIFRPRSLLAIGAGLASAAFLGFGWFAWQLDEVTVRESQRNLSNMARLLAAHTSRSVQAADLILRDAATSWATIGPAASDAEKALLHARIADRLSTTPQVRALVLLDAAGNSVIDSASMPPRLFNGSDREFFVAHHDNPGRGLFVSRPYQARLSGAWGISLSRRVAAPDGSFGGVVTMALEPKYFEEFHSSLKLGEGGSITLFRDDGVLLTRWPHREESIGKRMDEAAALFATMTGAAGPSVDRSASLSDGVERMRVHLKLDDVPLVVAVALPMATVLAPVAASRTAILASGTLTAATLLLLFLLLARHETLKDRLAQGLVDDKAAAVSGWHAAVESEKIKSLFWNGIGHDLRSPLCAMQTFLDLVLSEQPGGLTPAQREYLGQARVAVRLQFALIDNLLDFARLESGRAQLDEGEVDVVLLLEQVAELVQAEAERQGVAFTLLCDGPDVTLQADHRHLLRAALNIALNAVKYTPPPGRVTLGHAILRDGGVAVIVTDTGIGMTESDIERALQPYGRVDNAMTRKHQGSGLGLSIARGLVELHGGALTIESAPGKGTTVTIRLPAARVLARGATAPAVRLAGE